MPVMRLTPLLFRAARISATASAVASGDPKRIARRAKNITVGRLLRKVGFWRLLYK